MKYARKCSWSGKGMNEGWVIFGEYYSTIEMADEVAAFNGYADFEEMYKAENREDEDASLFESMSSDSDVYYTQWEDESDYQYEEVNGELIEIL